MADPLYWVTALTCAVSLALILLHDRLFIHQPAKEERAFRRLLQWVIIFCTQDVLWGVFASVNTIGDLPLFLSSTIFHASTVTMTYFWLAYVLSYLGSKIRYSKVYLAVDGVVVATQFIMLAVNCFTPVIFSIRDGIYHTEALRPLAFANQYAVYLLIGAMMLVKALRSQGEDRRKYLTVLAFSAAQIVTGVFQLLYPDAPFYTIGYFIGTIIIHLFIVQGERRQLMLLQHEMENQTNALRLAEEKLLSNSDSLTGLPNRRAYEEKIQNSTPDSRLIYISVDVNELKVVNDTLGHAAGDELLIGAANCLRYSLQSAGEVYRIGGDEYAALLHADSRQLHELLDELNRRVDSWHGETVKRLSLSIGVAEQQEFPSASLGDLARIADERMYRSKSAYYLSMGVDRQGQHKAYTALCASYEKILRVDLMQDSFWIISMDENEKVPEKGYSPTFSAWVRNFGLSGQVHPDDFAQYLARTELDILRRHFASGKHYLGMTYRRRAASGYHQVMMEMLPTESYTPDHQLIYLYVKNISVFDRL